jgi:hypothetical protein
MRANTIAAILCLAPLIGCEQPPEQNTAAMQHPPVTLIHSHPIHRFENVSPIGGLGVALDTVTGQWCRTWDWDYKGTAVRFDLNTLPLCKSLYDSYPADDSTDPFAQFGGKAITPQSGQPASRP